MSKGEQTRQTILDHAMKLASQVGLDGITIGRLAEELKLSKSGLFAHFQSKESLQIQVLQTAIDRFARSVVQPTLEAPRGIARIRALFEHWAAWGRNLSPGGCPFIAAAVELDDQPGAVRDFFVAQQKEWVAFLAKTAELAKEAGEFRADADSGLFAQELYSLMLGWHHFARLLRDRGAGTRAREAFESLVARYSKPRRN